MRHKVKQSAHIIAHKLRPVCYGIAAAVAVALFMAAAPAHASLEDKPFYAVDKSHKMTLKYDVYAGGFKALAASLNMDLDKKAYDMKLHAETQGFIGSLFPWKASFNTSGHAEQGQLIPSMYTESSTWKDSVKTTEMDYSPKGKL